MEAVSVLAGLYGVTRNDGNAWGVATIWVWSKKPNGTMVDAWVVDVTRTLGLRIGS